MYKSVFLNSFSAYKYHLRQAANPNIEHYVYKSEPHPVLNYTFYILGLPTIIPFLTSHLSASNELSLAITKDGNLRIHRDFFGIFMYDETTDMVHTIGSRDFMDGVKTAAEITNDLDDIVQNSFSFYTPSLPKGAVESPTLSEVKSVARPSACDCGAKVLGYKDSDDFAHGRWCNIFKS